MEKWLFTTRTKICHSFKRMTDIDVELFMGF